MKSKLFIAFTVIALLSLMLSAAAANAQSREPGEPRPGFKSGYSQKALVLDGRDPASKGGIQLADLDLKTSDGALRPMPAAPTVLSGAPGMTLSHVQTLGVAETAYYSDTQHLVYPYGVSTNGSQVWISDSEGNRALKFDSNGNYYFSIGTPGYLYGVDDDHPLEWITDIGVDSSGNVWLVDSSACYIPIFTSSGAFSSTLGLPWECGDGDYEFDEPKGIAFDASGNIFISDLWNHRVQVYDSDKGHLNTLGSGPGSGDYQFNRPEHIAIYGSLLYVADSRNNRIQVFDISNPLSITKVQTIGSGQGSVNGQFNRPRGVAVNASYIFVADTDNHRVQLFNRATYAYFNKFGSYGSGNTQLDWPTDVVVDDSGSIYVADNGNHRVQQFTSGLNYNRTYGATGVPYLTDQSHYNSPSGVAVAVDGSIYIIEDRGHRLVKAQADGTPIWKTGDNGTCGEGDYQFCYPQDVEVGSDGKVYVADTWNNRVQVFNSSGTLLDSVGEYGDGNGEFDGAHAVALDKTGRLLVVDYNNDRVQVFNSSLGYVTQFGGYGSANGKFDAPVDIAVDSTNRIYVVDRNNQRVQIFNSSLTYVGQIGYTDVGKDNYDYLRNPVAIAIDSLDRVYIATNWGSKIKIYDKDGKFLNCIDNGGDSFQGMFRSARGLALDSGNNLYLADMESHQVKKYIQGPYPGWRQMNVTGFGSHYNWAAWSMTVFSDTLYASTGTFYGESGLGAELYKYENNNWTQVMSGGFGESNNLAIDDFEEFEGQLYAGTWNQYDDNTTFGGQIWRSPTATAGSWEKVVDGGFGDDTNGEFMALRAFDGYLYAGTWNGDADDHGAVIIRSDSGDDGTWTKVFSNTIPNHHPAEAVITMEIFSNTLYAGLSNWGGDAELWRTSDGENWSQANEDGFGEEHNPRIISLEVFDNHLYAGVQSYDQSNGQSYGGQIWRSSDGLNWEKVVDAGFDNPSNWGIAGLVAYRQRLYAITGNRDSGVEVWRSETGDEDSWERVGWHSFGSEAAPVTLNWDIHHTVYHDMLYIGTFRWYGIGGGRVWMYLPESLFLPVVRK